MKFIKIEPKDEYETLLIYSYEKKNKISITIQEKEDGHLLGKIELNFDDVKKIRDFLNDI